MQSDWTSLERFTNACSCVHGLVMWRIPRSISSNSKTAYELPRSGRSLHARGVNMPAIEGILRRKRFDEATVSESKRR